MTLSDVSALRAGLALELSELYTCITVSVTRELPSNMLWCPPESGSGHSLPNCVGVMSLIGEC